MTSLRLAVENLEEIVGKGTLADAPEALSRKALGTIGRQCRHLVRLIDELLDVSRIEAGRFELNAEDADLTHVVRAAIGRLEAQSASAGCTVRLSASPARGRFDPSRLEQVATNLLSNAIKFGAGKPVEVEVRTADDELMLSVRDHGIGIAPEQQARIFERFERAVSLRHYGGLGLGLYIVRRIVEAHGGQVVVESVPGQGSVFTVCLPRVVS
jgi:signal transduction histidine kinase